ncbi:MAG: [Fe-Fe] hydrogenase large subunit C-terminal domain-containing protein [Candidatus Pacebacteria bacterium]|nr:[Fe-Fe] hydrogenase large subunit C-terminal domain-containing protein [Candidatus Paceibacterota bacterium]
MKKITIKINGKKIRAEEGRTILRIARENGIDIPTLCHHPDLPPQATCRLCLVEIKGYALPQTACSTMALEGMEIISESPELAGLRKTNLELLFSQHREECDDCVWDGKCALLRLAEKYKVNLTRLSDRKDDWPVFNMRPQEGDTVLQFDSSKCVDCRNCVEICPVGYLEIIEEAGFHKIAPSKSKQCIFCGQCLTHCPSGAFEAEGEFEKIDAALAENTKGKTVVFQFAPSIRTSIGEEFGLRPGEVTTNKIVGGLKQIGAKFVFDVSVGADFTTIEEAKELLEKLEKNSDKILFSSCCPAWVRYIECYWPEFTANLATASPPHIILGRLLKTYWARKNDLSPENIAVISIMPCVAKKYEIQRKEHFIEWHGKELRPVDYVLTTRELARLFQKRKIDFKKIKEQNPDTPFGQPSGAGVIYGASGGVMESALRSAAKKLNLKKLEIASVRGQQGIKTNELMINGKKMRLAVVNGIANAEKILRELKQNPTAYSCCEIMACPGGCIGGGGQPMPVSSEIRQARADGLYQIDKKLRQRTADENPAVKQVYEEFLTDDQTIEKICHTKYKN